MGDMQESVDQLDGFLSKQQQRRSPYSIRPQRMLKMSLNSVSGPVKYHLGFLVEMYCLPFLGFGLISKSHLG